MRHTIRPRSPLAALGLACAATLMPAAHAADPLVRIGLAAPVTGGVAHLGKDDENGAR
ncbi:hypothetical protein [Burkholderia stagnalis]|uniref:hypothetical protein n=1 Tax=Burkholderia stagnalis TaxID=1503054 RepID=UPI000B2427DB